MKRRWIGVCFGVCVVWGSEPRAARAEEPPPPVVQVAPAGQAPAPIAFTTAPYAPVSLKVSDHDVTFHIRNGTQHGTTSGTTVTGGGFGVYEGTTDSVTYQPLCTAPCTAQVQTGTHAIALSSGNGSPVAVEEPVIIAGPTTLEGHYTSNSGVRAAGFLLLFGGAIASVSAMEVAKRQCSGDAHCDQDTLGEIAVTGLFASIVGAVMGSVSDTASVTVTPGVPAAAWRSEMHIAQGPRSDVPLGITAGIRF